jgi:hypothetical protein
LLARYFALSSLHLCLTTTNVMSDTLRVPWQLGWGSAPSQLLYRCFTTTSVMSSYTF